MILTWPTYLLTRNTRRRIEDIEGRSEENRGVSRRNRGTVVRTGLAFWENWGCLNLSVHGDLASSCHEFAKTKRRKSGAKAENGETEIDLPQMRNEGDIGGKWAAQAPLTD